MEIIIADAIITINTTLLVQLASFLLFIFLLNKLMLRPAKKIAVDRSKHLNNLQNKINYSKKEVLEISTELEREKYAIIKNSMSITDEMEMEANDKAINIYNRTKEKISFLREKSNERITHQINELRDLLRKDVNIITVLVVEKVIGGKLIK